MMTIERPERTGWPLWQQCLVVLSAAAAVAVVTGVVLMVRSAEEFDAEPIAQVQPRTDDGAAGAANDKDARDETSPPAPPKSHAENVDADGDRDSQTKNVATASATKPGAEATSPSAAQTTPVEGLPSEHATRKSEEAEKHADAASEPKPAEKPKAVKPAGPTTADTNAAAAENNHWLKLDEHGEPCQVTLANGTVLALDTYGDEYEGYDYRPPITLYDPKLTKLIDFKQVHGHGNAVSHLHFDSQNNRMFWTWCVPPHQVGRILSADLDGNSITDLVTERENIFGFTIDPQRKKMYWTERKSNVDSVKRADLDGSKIEDIVPGAEGAGIAVEPESGDVFYWTHEDTARRSINRMRSDGSGEHEIINDLYKVPLTWQIVFDPSSRKLYWRCADGSIRRANYDGSEAEFVVDAAGVEHGGSFALDPGDQKVYWTTTSYMELCRANLDGSQVEVLVVSPPESENPEHREFGTVAFEPKHRWVYVPWHYFDGPSIVGALSRMEVPPLPTPVKKPPPPWIESVSPPKQAAGREVLVTGKGFKDATKVALFDDGNGHEVTASFDVHSDRELSFTMPTLSEGCAHAAVIVLTPGGVTVTLPITTSLARPNIWVGLPGSFEISTDFIAGKHADIWYVQGQRKRLFNVNSQETKTWGRQETSGGGIKSLIYLEDGSLVETLERGNNIVFVKDGAITYTSSWRTVIYHEPFALINNSFRKSAKETETTLVPVLAIRPSFLPELLEYEQEQGDTTSTARRE